VHADPLPFTSVGLKEDGTVAEVDGRPIRSSHLVVNEAGSRLEVVGERLASPAPGLTLYRIEDELRLSSYAEGLHSDGWARAVLSYRVWPRGVTAGSYRVRLELPKGRAARSVELTAGPFETHARLAPERPLELRIPASGRPIPPLAIRVGRADLIDPDTARPRLVGARVTTLEFISNAGSRNR
jgi:hypothetical protein